MKFWVEKGGFFGSFYPFFAIFLELFSEDMFRADEFYLSGPRGPSARRSKGGA